MNLSDRSKKFFIDQYTKQANQQSLRSRSWFKLKEIDQLDKLFCLGMVVIDLGSSPGGWSSYAMKKIGNSGRIVACDKFPMKEIPRVSFLKEDCANPDFFKTLNFWMKNQKAHVILSDMSPSTTGFSIIDVSKSIYLGNIALSVCHYFLRSEGTFLVKVFQGIGFEKYLTSIKSVFNIVKIRKPISSRNNSREVYIVGKKLKI